MLLWRMARMELLREIRNQARFRATATIQANRLMNDTGLGGFVDEDHQPSAARADHIALHGRSIDYCNRWERRKGPCDDGASRAANTGALARTRKTFPAFLIAGKRPCEIELIRSQIERHTIGYVTRSLGESLSHIREGPSWYRMSRRSHLYRRLLRVLFSGKLPHRNAKICSALLTLNHLVSYLPLALSRSLAGDRQVELAAHRPYQFFQSEQL